MIENAQIVSTQLGREDHGIFTAYLGLKGNGWGGGFGGYALDEYDKDKKRRVGTAYGLEFIKRVLKTVDVENWEDLKGKHCRILREGIGGQVLKIGHLLEDEWFDPKELLEERE